MAKPKGSPKTGGRVAGTPNKASAARAAAIAASGLTPLDYMLSIIRDKDADVALRLDAAKGAAPYVHPKLANMTVTGADGGPVQVHRIELTGVRPGSE